MSLFADERPSTSKQKSNPVAKNSFEPEMVEIPGGHFQMGDIAGIGFRNQKPVHQATIKPFQMSKYEVTKAEFAAFINATGFQTDAEKNSAENKGCLVYSNSDWNWQSGTHWRDHAFKQEDREPVVCISWSDAKTYIKWLNKESGESYRLPTESEWEYAARAGSNTNFPWGDVPSHEYANYGKDECCGGLAEGRDRWVNTSPAGSFTANAFGLHDMHGNVWEWTDDCWNKNYKDAPANGTARSSGDCGRRVLRGGSWDDKPKLIRSAHRFWEHINDRGNFIGFRLVLSQPLAN